MIGRLQMLFFITFLLSSVSLLFLILVGEIGFDNNINPIFFFSVLLYFSAIFYSVRKEKYLYFSLPFVLLGFPTIINNLFPGVPLGDSLERGLAIFPLITHIDVFLIINVFIYGAKNKHSYKSYPVYFILLCLFFLISSFFNFFYTVDLQNFALISSGLFFCRYFLLLFFLIINTKFTDNYTYFIKGVLFTVTFLFVESSIFTLLSGKTYLTSGSLGINSFGNIIGQVFVFLLFNYLLNKNYFSNKFKYINALVLILCVYIVLKTGTRMAILGAAINTILILFSLFSLKKFILYIVVGFSFILISIQFLPSSKSNLQDIFDNVSFTNSSSLSSGLSFEKSEATNSLITRQELNKTSINMIEDSPFIGIGFNRFNILKYNFGFHDKVTIDPHNGYFLLLSSLGIFGGILWIFFIFLRPFFLFYRIKDDNIKYLAIFNMGMAFCELSNAGIYKFQISSLLIFCAIILELQYRKEKEISIFQKKLKY